MTIDLLCKIRHLFFVAMFGIFFFSIPFTKAAVQPPLVGMGDSIGEGVQSGDAAWQTQVFTYLNWLGFQMGNPLSHPYIQTNFLGFVGNISGRSRVYPSEINNNVAVSGATVNSLLNESANAQTEQNISSETELVMFPRLQTQIEYVESVQPDMIVCWIGNNDILSAATSYGNMNASQLTPVPDFERDYRALVDNLGALVAGNGTKIVFANIPNVTDIGFLVDRAKAEELTGFSVALPDGDYTSIIGVLLMRFLGNDNLIHDPNFVLDSGEVEQIKNRIIQFNAIIQQEANRIGMPVVDINSVFSQITANPPIFAGIPVNKNVLGGLFSLDGVHPNNLGHALIANEFLKTINQSFDQNYPLLSNDVLTYLFLLDPSTDKDRDGKATGRLGVGLVETLAYLFGYTGDSNDFIAN